MRKSDKKIENQIIAALKGACELALDNIDGFVWLTHFVDYSSFPKSLAVVCVFDTNENKSKLFSSHSEKYLCSLINENLLAVGIQLKDVRKHVSFDTEEDCEKENNGKWNERFK